MSLSNPRIIYGIHSFSPRNRVTKMPYGILKVIGSCNLSLTTDLEQLYAGANRFAWAAENKTTKTDLSAKVKAYPNFLFSLFLGATINESGADTAGTVSTPVNAQGVSILDATIGLASVAVKPAMKANLKFGQYVIKALSATTLAIFSMSDIDLTRGTDVEFTDDSLALALATITIANSAGTDIDDLGLTLTGGSAVAFVTGDTATFEVKPPSSQSSEIIIGGAADSIPDFEATMYAQKRATGEMFEITAHNCVGGGIPINLEEQKFSELDLKMTCLYDSGLNRVFTLRHILPT